MSRIKRVAAVGAFLCALAAVGAQVSAASAVAQSRTVTRDSRAKNVVQAVRLSYERRPPEWRKRAAPCLHYLDEAETFHNQGEAYFVQASRARSSPEQSRLVRLGNDAIAERTRLINEFWSCTRRMTEGDVFASQDPPRRDIPPPHDPIVPPDVPPIESGPPERPPTNPWPTLPPGFPFPPADAQTPGRQAPRTDRRTPSAPTIVALGDSLTAGYGLRQGEAYPEVLQQRLRTEGFPHRVLNAGITNDTAAGARRRVQLLLTPQTRVLIVAVGLNDLKAGRRITDIEADIAAIIMEAQQRRVSVLLCGFTSPFKLDVAYDTEFKKMYQRLADRYRVAFLRDMMLIAWNTNGRTLPDDFHPNAEGARFIAAQVLRVLRPLLGTDQR